ncbi:MAG: type 1 glutamine amidotransferase [Deltaproteobacteria bacterium]|nr:type 1 glutamine amidotransferase [Deltaproteobacteria bacterium]
MPAPRVLVLQHHPLEHLGAFADALGRGGARLETVRSFAGERCPATLAPYDGLIVMGGPMSVGEDDLHPWLRDERALVAQALASDTPTLGVCLGSQLIAAVAGAPVAPGPVPEVGWYRIHPTAEAARDPLFADVTPFAALEWHRDAFPLPLGAVALASSAQYPVQAFRLGRRVYGLLFHLEIDDALIGRWCDAFADGNRSLGGDAAPDVVAANRRAVTIVERLFLSA